VQVPNHGARDGAAQTGGARRLRNQVAFLFVNNRLEGNAPGTIQAVASAADAD